MAEPTKLCISCDGVMEPFGGTRTGTWCPKCEYFDIDLNEAEKALIAKEREACAELCDLIQAREPEGCGYCDDEAAGACALAIRERVNE